MSDDDIPPREPVDLLAVIGLTGHAASLMRTKWALVGAIKDMIYDSEITEEMLADDIGEAPDIVDRWLRGMVRDVSLDKLAILHDAAAERVGSLTLEWIIRGMPESDGGVF